MILAIDVGNTQTVIGLVDAGVLDDHWRIHSNPLLTADELRIKIGALLSAAGHGLDHVEHVVISSVVPALTAAYEELTIKITGESPMTVGPGLKTGMAIKYGNPHEVGADRIVNGVAAFEQHGGPVVIVDFGTATTIDVVDASGAYLGG
ncbi:MAG: pantothenate kinase, partial [Actinobacteria bacterium HGW-Actinobacteria-10]